MIYGSLFSGIGGIDLAFDRAGMTCAFQAEREPSCLKVLSKYWPEAPKFTDVCDVNTAALSVRPDAIVGGFPCQDLSVAGRRAGLAGKRSGLFWEFMRILGEFRPRWVLLENVPGLLSSNEGRDMRAVVDALDELGYGWAYRVLDAQWFGVPQRRRRVFIVGCLGDFKRAARVLFEPESLPWDSAPRRKAGQSVAHCVAAGAGGSKFGSGRDGQDDFVTHAFAQNQRDEVRDMNDCSGALAAEPGMKQQTYVAYSIQERAVSTGTSGPPGKGWREGTAYAIEARHTPQNVATGSMVRRLMPIECLRLQGFPDDHLDGMGLSNSAKYRAIGNAVAVPVVEWIAKRIAALSLAAQLESE